MKNYIDRMTQLETAADRREFTRGMLGGDKFNVASFVGGVVAAWLLANPAKPNPKRK